MRVARVYADTSVFGGVLDAEFARWSVLLLERFRCGDYQLVVSALLEDELQPAPSEVLRIFEEWLSYAERVDVTEEAIQLQEAYIEANVVGQRAAADALHVATASISGCSVIVSWNFRHIVHYDRIRLYNAVNAVHGYPAIAIHSPMEMVSLGD